MLGYDTKSLLVLVGAGALLGGIMYTVKHRERPQLRGARLKLPADVARIAAEARSPEEYARRVEAWSAGEAKPPSITLMAKAYRGASAPTTARLIREAREKRLEDRERLWSRMSRGLRGAKR